MIAVASLIKPLATHEGFQEKPKSPPMIPPRTSSYSNSSYLQDFPTPPFRQKKMPVSSLKKPMKTEIKYASINKSSVGRTKRVYRNSNTLRQKKN
ncbi:uncharacterized protein B0P05DRAFT_565414 [Gilbertella persicaria]|nr:uncharacterized protein B0P05DRAFT_565414 [Gilbertella persicaria]KAI8047728.1 hypothetical protein B0P05DRAFT_565414 [Gilbertella persicaria]